MTTPAAAPASIPVEIPARLADKVRSVEITRPAQPGPADADAIEAMFRAFGCLIPGAAGWKFTPDDILEHLARYGASSTDLAVIRDWLTARQE